MIHDEVQRLFKQIKDPNVLKKFKKEYDEALWLAPYIPIPLVTDPLDLKEDSVRNFLL